MLSIIVNSSDSSRGSRPDRGAQNRASDQEEYMRELDQEEYMREVFAIFQEDKMF